MNHLQVLIKHSGLKQTDVAEMLEVQDSQISQACAGNNTKIAKRIVELLGTMIKINATANKYIVAERELYKSEADTWFAFSAIYVAVNNLVVILVFL